MNDLQDNAYSSVHQGDVVTTSLLDTNPSTLINAALQPVEPELAALQKEIISLTSAQSKTSIEIVNHVLGGGGKRIRPALFFLAAKLVDYADREHLLPMAAVCEFVHTASLLHDDVIDNSTLRRNKPTANSIWGDESSVLTGDLIYARASELMAATGSLEIVSMFARAIRLMSEGELFQLEHLYNPLMTEDDYFKIIENKTAVLLSAACKAPAVLAKRSSQEQEALSAFGHCVGHAFQLLDDALDYSGTTKVFGKKTLADLPEGKVTLPIILLRDQATSEEWAFVQKIIRRIDIQLKDMIPVLNLVNTYDTAGQTLELAANYTQKALKALEVFPDSQAKDHLINLAKSLLLRIV